MGAAGSSTLADQPNWLSAIQQTTKDVLSLPQWVAVRPLACHQGLVFLWEEAAELHRAVPARGQIEVADALLTAISPPENFLPDGEAQAWMESIEHKVRVFAHELTRRPGNVRIDQSNMGQRMQDKTISSMLLAFSRQLSLQPSYYQKQTSGQNAEIRWFFACLRAHFLGIFGDTRKKFITAAANAYFEPTTIDSPYSDKKVGDKLRAYDEPEVEPFLRCLSDIEWMDYWAQRT